MASKFMAFDDYKPDFPSSAVTLHPGCNVNSHQNVASYDTDEHHTSRHASLLALTDSEEGQYLNYDVKATDARGKVLGNVVKVGAVALGVAALAGIAALAYRKLV